MGAPGQGCEDSAVPPVLSWPCRLPRWLVAKAAGLVAKDPGAAERRERTLPF